MKLSFACAIAALVACSKSSKSPGEEIAHHPLDAVSEMAQQPSWASVDKEVSVDGGGSIKLQTPQASTLSLLELSGMDVAGSAVTFEVQVKTEGFVGGSVFLEASSLMGGGNVDAKGLPGVRGGNPRWSPLRVTQEFGPNDRPSSIRLKVQINGNGIAWIDAARVYKRSHQVVQK
jgi:hypothetical protein